MTVKNAAVAPWKKPVLLITGLIIILAMLRLGLWQLGRADEKQQILDAVIERSSEAPILLSELDLNADDLRFRKVTIRGTFLADKTIFVDRQVVQGQVGYQVFTPLQLTSAKIQVMVARGWVGVGASRDSLPQIETPTTAVSLSGRLNTPPARPPLWNDKYPVADGRLWQYLPIEQYALQMQLNLLSLVVELAPDTDAPAALVIDWPEIDDQWVAKHKGYAFQWFAMAVCFFIACLVLLVRRSVVRD